MADKVKVKEDVSVAVGPNPEQSFKAGQVTVTDKNREALDSLVKSGQAERIESKGE